MSNYRVTEEGCHTAVGEFRPLSQDWQPAKAQVCTRLPYHDGPCNGYQRKHCELKNRLEREGKIMKLGPLTEKDLHEQNEIYVAQKQYTRTWYKQVWAWIKGTL